LESWPILLCTQLLTRQHRQHVEQRRQMSLAHALTVVMFLAECVLRNRRRGCARHRYQRNGNPAAISRDFATLFKPSAIAFFICGSFPYQIRCSEPRRTARSLVLADLHRRCPVDCCALCAVTVCSQQQQQCERESCYKECSLNSSLRMRLVPRSAAGASMRIP